MSKQPFVLLTLFAMTSLWSRPGAAQLAPTGAHYAGRPSDTGHSGPNDQGGYPASIPLDLPSSRGGLPLPLQIVSGTRGFGAAGVGWDIPLSYVMVDNSIAHRRPAMAPGATVQPRERVSLSLLGRNVEMLPQGDGWIGRSATDLSMHEDGGTWTVVDGNGITYTFTQDSLLQGTGGWFENSGGLWLLQSIHGRAGAAVTLTYQTGTAFLPDWRNEVITVDLSRIDYNPDPSNTCSKHEIRLDYNSVAINAPPQSLSVIGELVVARFHSLGGIDVMSRASCADSPQRIHRYNFTYAVDPDTQQQQLASVTEAGRDGTPEASTSLPVASYQYGTATTSIGGKAVLSYGAPQVISNPGVASYVANTEELLAGVFQPPMAGTAYGSLQGLIDFTGDGRPDFVFTANGKLSIEAGLAGMSVGPPAQLNDATFTRPLLDGRSSEVDRFADESNFALNHDYVWTQSIDVNGDGRIDIIDAAEKPNTWVVYLNTPDSGPSGIKWVRRAYDVTQLHQRLIERRISIDGDYVPLSIRVTGRNYGQWTCWKYEGGNYIGIDISNCAAPPADSKLYVGPEQTYVEYMVTDINGDGYPDVVLNSSPTYYVPVPVDIGNGDHILIQQLVQLQPIGISGPNAVQVAYNVRGPFISSDTTPTDPFSSPQDLISASGCGVEEWVGDDSDGDRIQVARCALADVNGDGLIDRIEDDEARLGTGYSFNYTVTLKVPAAASRKFFAVQQSYFVDTCHGTGATWFNSTQTVGLRDLTGDGIPDLVEPKVGGGGYEVFVGTGAGFAATATEVSGGFLFSHVDELCDGSNSNTASGIYDIDGDGKPDFVTVNGGSIDVYRLTGGSQPGNPEAGKIVQVDNGYGAVTSITYTSAKNDATTQHQVPSPEIVVASIQTTGTLSLGGTLAATRYAYGNIDLYYDSTADAFRTTGYKRRVELLSIPGVRDGSIQSNATIIDRYPLDPVNPVTWPFLSEKQRLGRYLQAGLISDVTTLAGGFSSDAWSLLTVDVTTDLRRIGAVHHSVDATDTHWFGDVAPPTDDACKEVMYPYDYDLSVANNYGSYNPCSARGFLYTRSTQSWRGTTAPPSDQNVQIYMSIRSVDDYGRITSMFYQNDATQNDDDVCVDTTYATPTDPTTHVLSAIASRKVWACGDKGDGTTRAEESFEYDKLVTGLVFQGLPTSHTVYRHATDTGAWLSTIREYDADYDVNGDPIKVVTSRLGASRTTQISYDPFGLAPTDTSVSGTSLTTISASQEIDPITDQVLSQEDENKTIRGTTFDGFGRPVLQTIMAPGDAAPGVLAAHTYLGFQGGDPLGRRLSVEEFTDPVSKDVVGTGVGRVATSYFDEVGRSRFAKVPLGDDYAGDTLIVGSRTYDPLGRVTFEADAYPASQDPASAYGTTRYFDADGSLWVEIRGNGSQPFTTAPNAANEVFPSQYRHTFANHLETTTTQEADSLTTGSLQFGVIRQASSTAIGRVLSRSTTQNGARTEFETFGYELLGHQTALTRYQDPLGGSSPVSSSWKFDSLGQLLELDEPTSAPQTRSYSDWGELMAITWSPVSPEPKHTIVNGYDALGRMTFTEEQNDGVTDPATYNKYGYDTAGTSPYVTPTYVGGRLASASGPTGTVVFGYDGYGNVNARSYTDADANVYVEQQGFHGDGSQASITLELPDNSYRKERLDYAYDTAGRMRWMWFSDGIDTQELYNAKQLDVWGRVRDSFLANTEYAAKYADLGRRLPQEVKVSSTAGVRHIAFTGFDAVAREVSRTEDIPSAPNHSTTSYDALGRLQTTTRMNGATTTAKWSFAYDALGNVTSLHDAVTSSNAFLSYLSTDRDRICGVSFTGSPTSCNVAHDSFGNITTEPTRAGFNKLTFFNSGDVRSIVNQAHATATFAYDPFGELQELTIAGPTGSRHDRNFGAYITQRTQKTASASASYTARRFPGPGLSLSRRGPKGNWVYEFSEPGGTRFTTDEKGNFLQDLRYTPFGDTTSSGVPPGTDTFTTDQWNDGDALDGFGLVNVGKRIYDPALGRFLSRDPLLTPRTSATSNPYAFAMNDPVNLSDPSGMDACPGCSITANGGSGGGGSDGQSDGSLAALAFMAADYLFASHANPGMPITNPTPAVLSSYNAAFDARFSQLLVMDYYLSYQHPSTLGWVGGKVGDVVAIAGGAAGFVGGAGLCATLIGCALGAPMMVASADVAGAHAFSLVTGKPARSFVGQQFGSRAQAVEESAVGGFGMAAGVTMRSTGVVIDAASRPVPAAAPAISGVQANKAAGDAWSRIVGAELRSTHEIAVPEITVKTQSGVRIRLDWMTRDGNTLGCIECKASSTAAFTANQKLAFPEIARTGAVVVGRGRAGIPGGTVIPPTIVQVRRP